MPEHNGDSQRPGVNRSHSGLPDVLIVNNGPEFQSANLEDVIRGLKTRCRRRTSE